MDSDGYCEFDMVDEPRKHWMMDAFPALLVATGFVKPDLDSSGGYSYHGTTNFVGYLPIIVATAGLRWRQRWFRFLIGVCAPPWRSCEMWELRNVVACHRHSKSVGNFNLKIFLR